MKNKGLIVAVVILAIVVLALSVLCSFLIAERYTIEKLENKETDSAPEMYADGYVCFVEGTSVYHLPGCKKLKDGWEWVPEKYTKVIGCKACMYCMRGSSNTYTPQ